MPDLDIDTIVADVTAAETPSDKLLALAVGLRKSDTRDNDATELERLFEQNASALAPALGLTYPPLVPTGATGVLSLRAQELPAAFVGVDYANGSITGSPVIRAAGGVAPYTWDVLDAGGDPAELPGWLQMDTDETTAEFSGVPADEDAGDVGFVLRATDANGAVGTQSFKFNVNPSIDYSAHNDRVFTAQAVTQAGGEVRSPAKSIPAGAIKKMHCAISTTISAGSPVTSFKIYQDNGVGTFNDTGIVIPSITGAGSTSFETDAAGLGANPIKLGAIVSGTAAAALVTADFSWVVPAA